MPVSFDTSKMLALDGGRSLAMIASLNSLEYLMAIIVVSPCPYINTQITKIEATSFLTQGDTVANQIDKAIDTHHQAAKMEGQEYPHWWWHDAYTRTFVTANTIEKAIEAYERFVSINPEEKYAWKNLAFAYIAANQIDRAIEAHMQVARIDPNDADAWYSLGVAYTLPNRSEG